MKIRYRLLVSFCALLTFVSTNVISADIETIPEDFARQVGQKLSDDASKFDKLQVKVDADSDKANGFHVPMKLGVLLVPQKDLKESPELEAKFKEEAGTPIGYLFAYKVLPIVDGKRVDSGRLRTLSITDDQGNSRTVYVLLLAVRKTAENEYRLYGYGNEAKPVIDVKFEGGGSSSTLPLGIELKDADANSKEGNVVITAFGKYQAKFRGGSEE